MKYILLVLTSSYLASCIPVPPPHPAVVAVRQEEELLPVYLKSPHIFNTHLQQVLPLTSLLHQGEQPVIFLHITVNLVLLLDICEILLTCLRGLTVTILGCDSEVLALISRPGEYLCGLHLFLS